MNIEFIPIDYTNHNDCLIITKWFNDPLLNYLITPNFHQGELPKVTPWYISQSNLNLKNYKYSYFIVVDNTIVGDVNIMDNPDIIIRKNFETSWLGITIGEKEYRNYGLGKKAMEFIENQANALGFQRMELGVFSFNDKAITFYKKLGYKYFTKIPNFTYYNGIWYDDLRFEKML